MTLNSDELRALHEAAWMRRWAYEKNDGTKGNRPKGWNFQAVSEHRLFDDDVALYTADQIEALLTELEELRLAKWDQKHTSTANDLVQMGMARDAAIAERDALKARVERLEKAAEETRTAFTYAFARGFWYAGNTSRQCASAMDDAWAEYVEICAAQNTTLKEPKP